MFSKMRGSYEVKFLLNVEIYLNKENKRFSITLPMAVISEEHLSQLLSKDECLYIATNDLRGSSACNEKDLQILHYDIKKCSKELFGFMGNYLQLTIQVQVNLQNASTEILRRHYFIKSVPLFNEYHRAECEEKEFFRKECSIYQNILPNIQRYARKSLFAKCYYTRRDLIVLEDFSQSEKCLKHSDLAYTEEYVKLFLQHLAEMHAASMAWEFRENVSIQKLYGADLFELQLIATNKWFIVSIKGIVFLAQIHPRYQYKKAQDFINKQLYKILESMEQYTEPSKTLQNVFCHRDCWDSNIFFEYEKNSNNLIGCRLVDFQLSRYSPPALDVLYFLYNALNSMNRNDKENVLQKLLVFYYECLQKSMTVLELPLQLFTREHFQEDCNRALLPTLVLACIGEPLMKLPPGWSQKVREEESETFDRYMNVDRSAMFMRVAKLDPNYMNIILKPVQKLMEHFGYPGQ